MELSKKMFELLNDQVNHEFHAAYQYLAMAADFEDKNLDGFATWMKKQFTEEQGHAMKLYGFLNDRGSKVILKQLDAPKTKWTSCQEAFEDAQTHAYSYPYNDSGVSIKPLEIASNLPKKILKQI